MKFSKNVSLKEKEENPDPVVSSLQFPSPAETRAIQKDAQDSLLPYITSLHAPQQYSEMGIPPAAGSLWMLRGKDVVWGHSITSVTFLNTFIR